MATNAATREGRLKILEGLWLIGIEPGQLTVSPDLDYSSFLQALQANGVHQQFIQRAIAAVDWRASKAPRGTLVTKVMDWLRTAGYREDEIAAFREQAQGKDEQGVLGVLTSLFNERTAGAVIHKATGGKAVEGAVWNPFRTDLPPEGMNPKFGAVGVLNVGLQGGELPVPPPPGKMQPAAPQASPAERIPNVPKAPGAGGGGGQNIQTIIDNAVNKALAEQRDVTPEEVNEIIERVYGFSAFALDIPEIRKVLEDAAREDWDEHRIRGAIQATSWYRRTSDAERQWLSLEAQDPATATRRIEQQLANLRTLVKGFNIPEDRLREIATLSLKYGWNQAQTQRAIASEFRYDPTGEKSTLSRGLKKLADDFLVPLADQTFEMWGQQILAGDKSEEDFSAYLGDFAKSMFPQLTAAIDSGQTVRQFMDPYIQLAARTLEINPAQINLSDAKWMRALNQVDPQTGERKVMGLGDWEMTLKLDPKYGYDRTKQARQEAADLTTTILRSFGAI